MAETEEKNGRIYEVGFIASPNVPEDKIGEEFSNIKTAIEKNGGFFISEDFPKLRPLAYKLTKRLGGKNLKFTSGYFGWVKFELESGSIAAIKAVLETMPEIIRFLIVKTVRENTMYVPRPVFVKRPELTPKKEGTKTEEKPHETGMSEAELEKTIEDLVVE